MDTLKTSFSILKALNQPTGWIVILLTVLSHLYLLQSNTAPMVQTHFSYANVNMKIM